MSGSIKFSTLSWIFVTPLGSIKGNRASPHLRPAGSFPPPPYPPSSAALPGYLEWEMGERGSLQGNRVSVGEVGFALCVSAAPDPANASQDPRPARSAALPPRPPPGGARRPGPPAPPAVCSPPLPRPRNHPSRRSCELGLRSDPSAAAGASPPRPALAAAGTPRQVGAFPCLFLISRS